MAVEKRVARRSFATTALRLPWVRRPLEASRHGVTNPDGEIYPPAPLIGISLINLYSPAAVTRRIVPSKMKLTASSFFIPEW